MADKWRINKAVLYVKDKGRITNKEYQALNDYRKQSVTPPYCRCGVRCIWFVGGSSERYTPKQLTIGNLPFASGRSG